MPERKVVVASEVGLHARPAALVARAAAAAPAAVTISREGGRPVPADSILSLLTLGAEHGDTVVITANGDGADAALDAVARLVAGDPDAAGA